MNVIVQIERGTERDEPKNSLTIISCGSLTESPLAHNAAPSPISIYLLALNPLDVEPVGLAIGNEMPTLISHLPIHSTTCQPNGECNLFSSRGAFQTQKQEEEEAKAHPKQHSVDPISLSTVGQHQQQHICNYLSP